MGTDEIKSDNIFQAIEELVRFPLGQQLYIRPTWREVQPRPGPLDFPDYLKLVLDLAKKNNKRIGLRIQMSAPDYTHAPALPDFILEKVLKSRARPKRQGKTNVSRALSAQSARALSAPLR